MQDSNHQQKVQRVCLLTGQRSGSTWLLQLLGDHPDVQAYAELFVGHPVAPDFPDKSILPRRMYYQFSQETNIPRLSRVSQFFTEIYDQVRGRKSMVFKLMYNQIRAYPEVLFFLCVHRYKIIHLVRENYLDVAISAQMVKKTKMSHDYKPVQGVGLTVNVREIMKEMKSRTLYVRLADLMLAFLPLRKIRVSYQELLNDPQGTLDRIYDFIGVPRHAYDSNVGFKKTIREKPKEFITNYDELVDALKGTRYERYLATL